MTEVVEMTWIGWVIAAVGGIAVVICLLFYAKAAPITDPYQEDHDRWERWR